MADRKEKVYCVRAARDRLAIYQEEQMKVLLYFEGQHMIRRSGIGHAMRHQMAALDTQGIEWTLNEKDDYDILHLNTVGVASERIAKKARREGKRSWCMRTAHRRIFRIRFCSATRCHRCSRNG